GPPGPGADRWRATTGDTGGCSEGPGSNRDNPFRDRNRAVMVTVIGIAPGTNAQTASHRTVIRRLFEHIEPPTVPAVSTGNNLNLGAGTTKFAACSPFGETDVGNDVQGNGTTRSCTCGDSRSGNNFNNTNHCDIGGPGLCSPGTCAAGTNSANGAPTVVPPVGALWGDCNF